MAERKTKAAAQPKKKTAKKKAPAVADVEVEAQAVMDQIVEQVSTDVVLDVSQLTAELAFALENPEPGIEEEGDMLAEERHIEETSVSRAAPSVDLGPISQEELSMAVEASLAEPATQVQEEDGPLGPEEIAALVAQGAEEPAREEDGPLSPDEIAALVAQGAEEPAREEDGPLSPDEIAALVAQGAEEPAQEEDGPLSPDEIAALVSGGTGEQPVMEATDSNNTAEFVLPEDPPQSDPDRLMLSEDDIAGLIANVPETTAAAAPDLSEFEQLEQEAMVDAADVPVSAVEEKPSPPAEAPLQPVVVSTNVDHSLAGTLSPKLAIRALAVPLKCDEGSMMLAAATPVDHQAIAEIEAATGLKVSVTEVPIETAVMNIRELYGAFSSPVLEYKRPERQGLLAKLLRRSA